MLFGFCGSDKKMSECSWCFLNLAEFSVDVIFSDKFFFALLLGYQFHGGCCEGNGVCYEVHEPWEGSIAASHYSVFVFFNCRGNLFQRGAMSELWLKNNNKCVKDMRYTARFWTYVRRTDKWSCK